MAFCSLSLALVAIISFAAFGQMTGSKFCVLLASLNTDSQSCKFAFKLGGEVIKFFSVVVLVVWFCVKVRFGFGARLNSVWLSCIRVLFIVLILIGLHLASKPHLTDNDGHCNISDLMSDEELANLYHRICVAEISISAWTGVSSLLLMFAAAIASFVDYFCKNGEEVETSDDEERWSG